MSMKSLVLLGLILLPACAGAETEKAGAVPKSAKPAWTEAAGWDLFRGGVEDGEARVFQSADFQRTLVVPGTGESVFVLTLKTKEVGLVPRTALTAGAAGVSLAAGSAPQPQAPFTRKESDILFKAGGEEWRLAPEPPLIGEISRADLLARKKDYVAAARAYKPKSAAVSLIKSFSQPVQVTVFFGTWCSYCKEHLPRFMKTIDAAANPNITVRYIGVDEGLSQPEALIGEFGVSKTPTFVVRSGAQELGRILEEPKGTIEEDLALILMGGR